MARDRRDIVEMLRRENELLKARNQKLEIRLTRHQQAFRALDRMDETMQAMRFSFDVGKLINDLLVLALHACDSENGSLILVDDDTNELVFAEVIGDTREHLLDHRIDIDTGIVGHVVKTRKAMLVTNVHASSRWSAEVDRVIGFNTNALMCAPLYSGNRIYGAIEVVNNLSSDDFDDNDLAILRVTGRFVSQALREAEDITQ
ncbi:MAG: GAF domain-containing protein, partial [Gammaproteobacteria bacterium]|nr:GAF domain-containing protein [Gammaproteobacteria bacterium]